MNPMKTFPATALFLFVLTISNLHFLDSKPSGFQFKLIPRDSPESPLYPGNLTHTERLQRLVKFTQAKASFLSTQNASLEPDDISVPLIRDDIMFYVGHVGIGTPAKWQWLLIDTGSDLIWTQCEPCKTCFRQNDPLYNSKASTSYEELPCSDPICSLAGEGFKCENGKCVYDDHRYGTGDVTRGVVSRESFEFKDSNAGRAVISKMIFGCSNNNEGFKVFADRGVISGIMGLDLHPFSLVSQLSTRIGNRFSYCMAPFAQGIQSNLYLRFGEDVPRRSARARTTPFVIVRGVEFYMLNLIGISVGSKRVDLPTDAFRRRHGGSQGFFIDSGTPYTVIGKQINGKDAYKEVMQAFQEHYNNVEVERQTETQFSPDYPAYEFCYINKPNFDLHPTMTYHFEGADYVVDSKYVTVNFREQNYFCVTIVEGGTESLLGAYHQQNMRIIYDGNLRALQFYTENCARDHMP